MPGTGLKHAPFGGFVREFFNDAAMVEIWSCPVLQRGDIIAVAKKDFAEQSFRYGLGKDDYVEGVVEYDPNDKKKGYEFKHVTKIV
jgi:hypothetical protein